MSQTEPASAYSGAEPRAFSPRARVLGLAVLAALALVTAGLLLAGSGAIGPRSVPTGEAAEYRQQATAILDRHDAVSASVAELLAEQERDPWSQSDPQWRLRFDAARSESLTLKAAADALRAPVAESALAAKLSEGLGLYSTGLDLLGTGFGRDGHGAYYYGSHGNWDLNLAATRLEECRRLLATGS